MGARLRGFRRPFALLWERRAAVLIGVPCVPLGAVCALAMPLVAGRILDLACAADGTAAAGELLPWCGLFAALALGDVALRFVGRYALIGASRHMEERLKNDLMRHVGTLPVWWHDRARTGDLISRLTQDVELLRFLTGPTLLHGGQALVVVPGGVYLMFTLSPWVAATALIAFAGLLSSLRSLLPRTHDRSVAAQEAIGELSQRANEVFTGVRVLQAFARMRDETRRMERLSDACLGHNLDVARLRALCNLAIRASLELVILAVMVVGALEVVAGRMTVGTLLEFYALLGVMVWPLLAAGWLLSALPRAAAAADRVEEVFAVPAEPRGGATVELRGAIEIRGLTFAYPGHDQPSLRGISFALAAGRKLGLVGPVGSGKSTLLALLLRLYDPPRGAVFVDGHDVLDLDPHALRAAFAFVPQEPFLFSDSVGSNIEFGSGQDGVAIDRSVHAAGLDADLNALPQGLDTVVGVRGVTLSGGQKQRVALARALATERPVLLLDDTLSAVDHSTEQRILARLDPKRRGRTTIVASHRISAVRDADLILVLDRGEIVARGRHEELLDRGDSYYANAWRRQTEARALDGVAEEGTP